MPGKITWTIEPEYIGLRLDAAISSKYPDISRSVASDMIKNSEILLNGDLVKPSIKLKGEEVLTITFRDDEAENTVLQPTPMNFPVLFEDDDIIVINKPTGLVVHPGAGGETETVVSALLSHTNLSPVGAPIRPGVVQRLDKETSGIMILAKTRKAHMNLAEAFAGHDIHKEYIAIAQGHIANKKGRIEVAIERDRVHRKRMKATSPENGRMAISKFEVIEYLEGASLVRVKILTGRTHQIRVHMQFIGHSLYGDATYGGRKLLGKHEHFLHSAKLSLKHPITGEQMTWEADPPEAFQEAINKLKGLET